MKTTRETQIAFLILLTVCFAQVGWWIVDQVNTTRQVKERLLELYRADVAAADRLLAEGVEPSVITSIYPHLELDADGPRFALSETEVESLRRARFHHLHRYGWEGAFFLVVLAALMLVIGRLLRRDAQLRRRQQNFLALVSHELESPLASLKLGVDTLALRDPDAEKRRELLGRMKIDLDRWHSVVSNILDANFLQTGRLRLERMPVALDELARSAAQELRLSAEASGVELQVKEGREVTASADPMAVRVVVHNLLDNAIKAAAAADGGRVWVEFEERRQKAELRVRDDGIGFDSDEAEHLFEEFYRPGHAMRPGVRGAGLGLFVVRKLVQAGGGEVTGESLGPGKGATFRVRWPLAEKGRSE